MIELTTDELMFISDIVFNKLMATTDEFNEDEWECVPTSPHTKGENALYNDLNAKIEKELKDRGFRLRKVLLADAGSDFRWINEATPVLPEGTSLPAPITDYTCPSCNTEHMVRYTPDQRPFKVEQAGEMLIVGEVQDLLYCDVCAGVTVLTTTGFLNHIPSCPKCGEVQGLVDAERPFPDTEESVDEEDINYMCLVCRTQFG